MTPGEQALSRNSVSASLSRGRRLIKTVMGLMRRTSAEAQGLDVFSELLLDSTGEAGLAGIDIRALTAYAHDTFNFLLEKPPNGHQVRVRRVEFARDAKGQPHPRTVVEVVNDDMPYLVDSVMAEIQDRNLAVHLVMHPIYKARRYGSGRLTAVTGPGDEHWNDGQQESFISALIDPLDDADAQDLAKTLDDVLIQVRRAIVDAQAMRTRLDQAIRAYESLPKTFDKSPMGAPMGEIAEAIEFLRWLGAGNFLMLGARAYELAGAEDKADLWPIAKGGLGLLRAPEVEVLRRGTELVRMTPEIRQYFYAPSPLIITKANVVSRVHRRQHLDYIGIKTYSAAGRLVGELRLVGLFTPSAYMQSVRAVPVLRQKIKAVLEQCGFPAESHNGVALIDTLETFPRDELFQIGAERLKDWSVAILDLELRPRPRVFVRRDRFDRFVSVLVYVPRDRFNSTTRERIGQLLAGTFKGRIAAYYPYFTNGKLVRTQFIIGRTEGPTPDVPDTEIEARVNEILRTWNDTLGEGIDTQYPAAQAGILKAKYATAFSPSYTETFSAARATHDIARIERLGTNESVAIEFYREAASPPHRLHAAVYRFDEPIPLSRRVPVFENLGFSVIDERSYRVAPQIAGESRTVALHDMVIERADGQPIDLAVHEARLEACFLAIWRGDIDDDSFNRLIVPCHADAREVATIRAYSAYLRQIGVPFGQRYLADTLLRHASITRDLMQLFRLRFNPDWVAEKTGAPGHRKDVETLLRTGIEAGLQSVASLDEDRILRHFLNLILATNRTNFYQRDAGGESPPTIAFKLDSHAVDGMPAPRPFAEIFVYSPRVEGIHLRNAPIARGGLRWSDRAQDFRTEVLGLAKAQQVKNAVIVPAGAKGGFVPKLLPREATRDAIQAEGIAAYQIFVSALLSLTDNLVGQTVKPPERTLRYDGDDTYLVVAADKGTATFSDTANALSLKCGFWLDDAFASGGSAGYDHKKMAITARGGWECVKRHFREIDVDIQSQPVRVIGVGDMSGDVFGNAMLLSRTLKLVAAFDHRDIVFDPDPDPARSYAERKRLFDLPRSSWQDYDRAALSNGGGIFPRSAKSIALTAEVQALLGIKRGTASPAEVITAILKAPCDLLWFGGIGTYVRAAEETDDQVGDRGNDGVRITAGELGSTVIGEGANLAMTQRARIAFARAGGRLNTDFIDNSAGVNCSDQEVNIKIALAPELAAGRLDRAARNDLLASLTQDVGAACLRNNYLQSLGISLDERRGLQDLSYQQRLIRDLEQRGLLDRKLEVLPSEAEFAARAKAGAPLTRPELAVLLSHAKIALFKELLQSRVPDDPFLESVLLGYFPKPLRDAYGGDITKHRLKREIIATGLTNDVINRGSSTIVLRLQEETGRGAADIAYAFMAAQTVHGLRELWRRIDALDGTVKGALQLDLYRAVQDLLRRETSWFLRHAKIDRGLDGIVSAYGPGVGEISAGLDALLSVRERTALAARAAGFRAGGVPDALARSIAALGVIADATDIALVAKRTGRNVSEAARVYWQAGEHFRIGELRSHAEALELTDYFDRLAINSTLATLSAAQRAITMDVVRTANGGDVDFAAWTAGHAERIARARKNLDESLDGQSLTLSRLAVAASQVRDLTAA